MANNDDDLDVFALLPREIVREIFTYLNAYDLGRTSLVSKYWRSVANDDTLWKRLCSERRIRMELFPERVLQDVFMKEWEGDGDLEPQCQWASLYRIYYSALELNWVPEDYKIVEAPGFTETIVVFDSFIILTLYNVPFVIVYRLTRGKFKIIQRIRFNVAECSVQACTNAKILVITACNTSFLFKWNGSIFNLYKKLFIPENHNEPLTISDDPFAGFNPTMMLICYAVTDRFIWFGYSTSSFVLYDFSPKLMVSVKFDPFQRVVNSGRKVFIKSEREINVHKENGDLIYSYKGDELECFSFTNRFLAVVDKSETKKVVCVNLKTSSQVDLKLREPIYVVLNSEDDSMYCIHSFGPNHYALSKFNCGSADHLWTIQFEFSPKLYLIACTYVLLRYKTTDLFLCPKTGQRVASWNWPADQCSLSERHYDSRVVVKKVARHGGWKYLICNYLHFDQISNVSQRPL